MSYVVIKCGGSVLENLPESFYKNIIALVEKYQLKPIIVHGGGPVISNLLNTINVETSFVDGMRVTTEEVLDVVEMGLSGIVNKKIVREITAQNGKAIGLSGVDNRTLQAEPLTSKASLGFVGQVAAVNTTFLTTLAEQGVTPVLSPVAIDEHGQRWNINADLAAGAVAKALQAPLYMVTNVPGVLKQEELIPKLTASEAKEMIRTGLIYGGMIPKVQTALDSVEDGVKKVVILNGFEENSLLDCLTKDKAGTTFERTIVETIN